MLFSLSRVLGESLLLLCFSLPSAEYSKHWTLDFSQDAGNQGALCSVAGARIRVERLSSDQVEGVRKFPRKSRGINLYDEECDSFHIYYDRKEKNQHCLLNA